MTAAMHFFALNSLDDTPSTNALPSLTGKSCHDQWEVFRSTMTKLINRYVLVHKIASVLEKEPKTIVNCNEENAINPHVSRIVSEHNYHREEQKASNSRKSKRKLPAWLMKCGDEEMPSIQVRESTTDGVFNYASAVLNDGLLLLELRDAIHEGDGPRIIRSWKFMLLYWWHAGHTKYVHEAIHLICAIEALVTPRVAQELIWCRTVNTRGGVGNNIPVDLFLEHLNRTLKDYLHGIGPNISEDTIVQASKSLKCLLNICTQFDQACNIKPKSIHHTKSSSETDRNKIIQELTESKVFDYIPGRYHHTFKNITPHISSHIQVGKLMNHIHQTRDKISKHYKLKKVLSMMRK